MKKLSVVSLVIVLLAAFGILTAYAQAQPGDIKITIPQIDINIPGLSVTSEGTTHSVIENHQTVTFDCKKESVSVMGNHNHVTIKGDCTNVSLMGNHNTVTIESVPNLSVSGSYNTVTVTAVGNVSIMGRRNSLVWTKGLEGEPVISNLGKRNTVTKAAE